MMLAVSNFDAEMLPLDHAEAVLIDAYFDQIGPESPKEAAKAKVTAIRSVDEELSDPMSLALRSNPELFVRGADTFGYQTAKDALRWWNYRERYLDDLTDYYKKKPKKRPIDVYERELTPDPKYRSQSKQLKSLRREHALNGDRIYEGDAILVSFYARLERLRRKNLANGDFLGEALLSERELAVTSLVLALKDRFDEPQTVSLGGKSMFAELIDAPNSDIKRISAIKETRKKLAMFSLWITHNKAPFGDGNLLTADTAKVKIAKPYIFTKSHKKRSIPVEISPESKKQKPISTNDALRVISGISANPAKAFKKGGKFLI